MILFWCLLVCFSVILVRFLVVLFVFCVCLIELYVLGCCLLVQVCCFGCEVWLGGFVGEMFVQVVGQGGDLLVVEVMVEVGYIVEVVGGWVVDVVEDDLQQVVWVVCMYIVVQCQGWMYVEEVWFVVVMVVGQVGFGEQVCVVVVGWLYVVVVLLVEVLCLLLIGFFGWGSGVGCKVMGQGLQVFV